MIYIIVVIALAIVGIAILAAAVKIVRPFQRGLVERLGKYKATKDPGLQLILPFIDTMRQAGGRQPEPREVGGLRLLTLHDPCENTVLLVGHPERPDEPLMHEGIGSVSIFVSDLAKARAFYVDAWASPCA